MKQLTAIFPVVLACLVTWSCAPDPSNPANFEKMFGIGLPSSARVVSSENKGSQGMIVQIKLPKTDFTILTAKKSTYEKWHIVTNGMSINAASRSLTAPSEFRGIYSVGRETHGLVYVLVWDEASETLTAFLASGVM